MAKGKKYLAAQAKVEKEKQYDITEGMTLMKEISFVKFDEAAEFVVRLNIEQKHSIRGSLSLPHSTGDTARRVLVFVTGDQVNEALSAGADYAGFEELVEKIKGGWVDFDVAIAHPDLMKEITKLGPILGRKGLMPNPKVGTVSENIAETVVDFKKGRLEYRADKTGIVHMKVGKISMDPSHLVENTKVIFQELLRKKPLDIKGDYIKSIYIASTMGPSIKIDAQSIK